MPDRPRLFLIYIDRNDRQAAGFPPEVEYLREVYLDRHAALNLEVRLFNYSGLYDLLRRYDTEFARYFSMIDPDFAAGMADIGRILLLYRYGGIYHDANFYIRDGQKLQGLLEELRTKDILLERHPLLLGCLFMIRNRFIAARTGGLVFFRRVLERQKANLIRMYRELKQDESARHHVWAELGVDCMVRELESRNQHRIRANRTRFLANGREDLRDIYRILDRHQSLTSEDYDLPYGDLSCGVRCLRDQCEPIGRFYDPDGSRHWYKLQKTKPILKI